MIHVEYVSVEPVLESRQTTQRMAIRANGEDHYVILSRSGKAEEIAKELENFLNRLLKGTALAIEVPI